jgi:hypothetical protein
MILYVNNELIWSIIIYLILVVLFLTVIKKNPRWFLTKTNKIKEFGVGKHKTILPLWMYFIIGAFIIYILTISFIIV